MSALLNITEPNNNTNSNDNDFLASLTTDAPQAIASKYSREQIAQLFDLPLMDLLLQAQTIHRQNFNANEVQISTLLSIKTGNCPEDCGYCSQSGHHRDKTKLVAEKRIEVDKVIAAAKRAKATGSSRFCMGAAWKHPSAKDMPYVVELVKEVKALGLETCMTLGMLDTDQAAQLADAGLDYYNHNLDTSRSYYEQVVSTRSYDERLDTITNVRNSGINVCSGNIVGMGESRDDRIDWVHELLKMPKAPESIPVNLLVPIQGTPIGDKVLAEGQLSVLEWIRTIAVTRICCPSSYVRLSAGRESLSDAEQALAFMAGANSFFYGDKLLTTGNASQSGDDRLMRELGLTKQFAAPRAPKQVPVIDAMSGHQSQVVLAS
ncbi:biotin synthase BioB [Psychrobacter cryohalolentis]|uniref:Biotin synthase n=1 Tax=Psychrobacter cryohalolentis (strain ATCC BAA-1226 / DSM 17306 / VKM B-2378 / K5) TaxID=335284 RepID=BIOB_PSYCK|nr:biotin synthase BioB [Psychrobacter cryohalolentis]Q1Q8S6.1 RecName: Full=Biotin synthase [Psychrobacter cryohalolentis K5]ABE75927.1 biotin synthase [Psychrobacter cryohalolentis K5]ASE26108.1 biotin synthase [Psychrobacter cryohalolentis]